jgi:plasmid maintenance system antidote protein VapI
MPDTNERGTAAKLLDFLLAEGEFKNDAELARAWGRDSAYISKLRTNKIPVSANLILFIHENYGLGVQEIRDRSGQRARWCK